MSMITQPQRPDEREWSPDGPTAQDRDWLEVQLDPRAEYAEDDDDLYGEDDELAEVDDDELDGDELEDEDFETDDLDV